MLQINYGNKYLAITWFNNPFSFFIFWETLGLTSQMYCSSDSAQILINCSRGFSLNWVLGTAFDGLLTDVYSIMSY